MNKNTEKMMACMPKLSENLLSPACKQMIAEYLLDAGYGNLINFKQQLEERLSANRKMLIGASTSLIPEVAIRADACLRLMDTIFGEINALIIENIKLGEE